MTIASYAKSFLLVNELLLFLLPLHFLTHFIQASILLFCQECYYTYSTDQLFHWKLEIKLLSHLV